MGGGLEVSGSGTALDRGSLGDVDRDRGRRRTGDLRLTHGHILVVQQDLNQNFKNQLLFRFPR